jgi:hypothetical protein
VSFASRAVVAVFVGSLIAIAACSSDKSTGTQADDFCAASKSALKKCPAGNPCDGTLAAQCGTLPKGVSSVVGTAARDCLESGICGASTCLGRSQAKAQPSAAHSTLAQKYCSTCAADSPDCAANFYAPKGTYPGSLVLPYADAVVTAVQNACVTDPGTCRATFATCANDTIASTLGTVVPPDLATCITTSLHRDDDGATAPDGGEGTSGGPQIQSCTPDNCKGCCKEDKCIDDGSKPAACGANGAACQTCSSVQQCTSMGECHEPCGPNNCKGCCDGDTCIPGDVDEKCGGNGEACTKCNATNPDLICEDQKCIDGSCKATCLTGCCTAAGCQDGTDANACGKGAAACTSCGYGRNCTGQACVLDESSLWDFFAASAVVPLTRQNGDYWDPFYGLPDPYVKAYSSLGTASHTGQTAVQQDTLTPTWNESPLKGISAKELLSNLSVEFWDSDYDADDLMGGCRIGLAPTAFDGSLQVVTCPASASTVSVKFYFKIQRH